MMTIAGEATDDEGSGPRVSSAATTAVRTASPGTVEGPATVKTSGGSGGRAEHDERPATIRHRRSTGKQPTSLEPVLQRPTRLSGVEIRATRAADTDPAAEPVAASARRPVPSKPFTGAWVEPNRFRPNLRSLPSHQTGLLFRALLVMALVVGAVAVFGSVGQATTVDAVDGVDPLDPTGVDAPPPAILPQPSD